MLSEPFFSKVFFKKGNIYLSNCIYEMANLPFDSSSENSESFGTEDSSKLKITTS